MTHRILSASALAITLFAASNAAASPEPMSEEELMEASDLVVDVEVVDVICGGDTTEYDWGTETRYVSTLQPTGFVKGEARGSLTYRATIAELNEEVLGCTDGDVALPEGWVGRLYLQQDANGVRLTDWSGAIADDTSEPLPLPTCSPAVGDRPGDNPEDDFDGMYCGDCATDGSGCSFSPSPLRGSSSLGWLAVLGLGLAAARRRR